MHSLIAATPHPPSDILIEALDESLDQAVAAMREGLDMPDLAFDPLYPMEITDLVVCAGEANGHPKHFAYFLPEDQGVPDAPDEDKRTLVFRNVYRERYRVITEQLAEVLLDGPRQAGDIPVEPALLTWLRGHDIGHSARLSSTDYGWETGLGHEPFMMLQEALADVYGFLLATTEPWLEVAGLSPTDCGISFMAEALHYLRRGPWHYGDAGAAYLELSYLAVNGFVDVEADGTVRWTLDGLREGMRQLALALADAILRAEDSRPSARLIGRYGWSAATPALQVLAALRWELSSVPTTLAYQDARLSGDRSSIASARDSASLAALVDWSAPARGRGVRVAS